MRKIVLCFIVVMVFAGYASAATVYEEWTGLAGDGLYSSSNNWANTNGTWGPIVPTATDHSGVVGTPNNYKAGFKRAAAGQSPTFSSGTISTDQLVCGGTTSVNPSVTISGVTFNVSQYVSLGANTTDFGTMVLNSGTINTGVQSTNATFYVTQLGTGKLVMNGGTINCGLPAPTWVGRPADYSGNLSITGTTGAGTGTLYLNGGTINAKDLLSGTGTMRIYITDGVLLLKNANDLTGKIQTWIDNGWIAGGGTGYDAVTEFANGITKVYATPEPATVSLLGLGLLSILRRKK